MPAELESRFEPRESRTGYLKMQALLADMSLADRVGLGRYFEGLSRSANKKGRGFTHGAVCSDGLPDVVFIFGSSINVDRKGLVDSLPGFTLGAMAYYDKSEGIMIVDRDGKGFEVALYKNIFPYSQAQIDAGARIYGNLKMKKIGVGIIGQRTE